MDRKGGSADLLEDFCRDEYPRLVRMLSLYCSDRSAAEDLAQETLARVWQHWDRVARLDAPALWSRRVALNLANSWHRRQRILRRKAITGVTFSPVQADVALLPASNDAFRDMVAGLPPRQRAVLVLRFYEDLSVTATAEVLRIREGTVKASTAQALRALRENRLSDVEGQE